MLAAFLLSPYRCRSCRTRFYRYFGHADELDRDDAPESQLADRDYAEVHRVAQETAEAANAVPDVGDNLEFEWLAHDEPVPEAPAEPIVMRSDVVTQLEPEPQPEPVLTSRESEPAPEPEPVTAAPEPARQPFVKAMAAAAAAGAGSSTVSGSKTVVEAPTSFTCDEEALARLFDESPSPGDRPYRRIRRALWEATFSGSSVPGEHGEV